MTAFEDDTALAQVLAALPEARLVGGCVRDLLAHRAIADIDIATPTPPDDTMLRLQQAGLRVIPTGLAHGTVTALVDGRPFEITTLRRDVETDGRHAVVAFTDDWREDAARRDFTINAMSMTPDGTLFDYFGGRDDLAAGIVRFVGDPATRIAEDYLRILRFFRFFARYGTAPPDAAALSAITSGTAGLARLSAERVWSEMKRILAAPRPDAALALMRRSGVMQAVLPGATEARIDHLPAEPVLRLAALLPHGDAPLNLSGDEAALLLALQGTPPPEPIDDAALRRLLADTTTNVLAGRALLAGRSAHLQARIEAMPVPVFPVQGRDLIARGVSPGPEMGRLLARLRQDWMASGCTATQADLLAQLAQRRAP